MLTQETRTRSLRTYLFWGLMGLFLVGFGFSYGLRAYALAQVEAQSEAQLRALSRIRAQQDLQRMLLEESFQLRAHLQTGDLQALQASRVAFQGELEAARTFFDNLRSEDVAALELPIQRLQNAIADWHREVLDPVFMGDDHSIRRRGVSELLVLERKRFSHVREEADRLIRMLDQRDNERLVLLDRAMARSRWIAMAGLGLVLLIAMGWMRWLLARIADPLRDLAESARSGAGFPDEPEPHPVREVDILRRALYGLDRRGREREQALREGRTEAQAIQGFGELVQRLDREDDLVAALEQALRRLAEPEDLRIALRPPGDPDRMDCVSPLLAPEDQDHRVLRQPGDCRAIQRGQAVQLPVRDPLACRCTFGLPEQGAYLCVPLVASGEALGIVNLRYRMPAQATPARQRLAEALAASAAQALQLLRALATARDQALRDGLTGAYNRRFLDEVLPKEVEQARRREAPLSVVMLDIDHFKRFNDSFGHEVGDRVLALFARTLQARLRSGDLVARYGGEEFTVVLPGAGAEEARVLAERLRAGIEALELVPPEFPEGCRITASLGVATFPQHGHEAEALLQAADRGLYLAKGQGRNRVVATPLDNPGTGLPS